MFFIYYYQRCRENDWNKFNRNYNLQVQNFIQLVAPTLKLSYRRSMLKAMFLQSVESFLFQSCQSIACDYLIAFFFILTLSSIL